MSVNIKFEPAGITGVVAEGTYLWDAAKRIGLRLPAECGGRGECDTCAVLIEKGTTLLSSLTNAERVRLSPERLSAVGVPCVPAENSFGGGIKQCAGAFALGGVVTPRVGLGFFL